MYIIAGKIKDESGNPIAGAKYKIALISKESGYEVYESPVFESDTNGSYVHMIKPQNILGFKKFPSNTICVVMSWIDNGGSFYEYLGESEEFLSHDRELYTVDVVLLHYTNQKLVNAFSYKEDFVRINLDGTYTIDEVFVDGAKYKVNNYVVFGQKELVPVRYTFYGANGWRDISAIARDEELRTAYNNSYAYVDIEFAAKDNVKSSIRMNVAYEESTDNNNDGGGVVLDESLKADLYRNTAFFVNRTKGFRDGVAELLMFFSKGVTPEHVEFYIGDAKVLDVTSFDTNVVNVPVPASYSDDTATLKMVTTGNVDGQSVTLEYSYDLPVYKSVYGSISTSIDTNTGERVSTFTATENGDEIVEYLWQIVYKSPIVQKVITVNGDDYSAPISVVFEQYKPTGGGEIMSFKPNLNGEYDVVLYAINRHGDYFKFTDTVIVTDAVDPQSVSSSDLKVGDSITIGAISSHGEVPVLHIYTLDRNGIEEVDTAAMNHAYGNMFYYTYTIQKDNAFYIFRSENSVVVKKVGIPKGCIMAFSKNMETGKTIPYSITDFNGNEIASGYLNDSGFGLYYALVPENASGILDISGNKKII